MVTTFGLAVPKPNPQSRPEEVENFNKLWTAIHTEAGKQGFQYPNPKFAWKFNDGDGTKDDGSAYPNHSKGCIVLKCETRVPINIFKRNSDGSFLQITPDQIKCGDKQHGGRRRGQHGIGDIQHGGRRIRQHGIGAKQHGDRRMVQHGIGATFFCNQHRKFCYWYRIIRFRTSGEGLYVWTA